ncbi:MAG: DUF4139 domain-containing protein [Myxococcota bacterium]
MLLVSSTVARVTVHRQGALVRRRLSLANVSERQVRIPALPLALDDDSVRAYGSGVEELRVALAVPSPEASLAPPTDEALREAKLQEARADARVASYRQALGALQELKVLPRVYAEQGPISIPAEARQELLRFRGTHWQRLLDELRRLEREAEEALEKRVLLEEQKSRATTARQARPHELRKAVDLRFREVPSSLEIEYTVPGARWAPSYVLRFDEALSRVSLEMRALVAQRSGEDWSDAELTLSTAHLQQWAELPDLPALRIGRRQPPQRRGFRPAPVGAGALFADYDRAFPSPPTPAAPPSKRPGTAPRVSHPFSVQVTGKSGSQRTMTFSKVEVTIGRVADNDIVLTKGNVSKRHARLVRKDGHTILVDLKSTNGTYVNGRKITSPLVVKPNDKIYIGEYVLTVLATDVPAMSSTTARPEPPPPQAPKPTPVMRTMSVPMPSAAPQGMPPMAAAPPPAMSAPIGGSAPMPMAKQAKKRSRREDTASFGTAQLAADLSADLFGAMQGLSSESAPLRADEKWLAFGRLRMGGVNDPHRGQLRPMELADRYREALGQPVAFSPAAAFRDAVFKSGEVDPWPEGAVAPTPVDGFDYAFVASHPVEIPSDGSFHSVPVRSVEVVSRPWYVAVPRESDEAFRFVEFTNSLEGPLLAGSTDVYVGGSYLLTRAMKVVPTAGKLSMGLGVEQSIKIARNARFEEQSAGLMGRALELVHAIEIDVTNLRSQDVQVEVRERVPVAREGDEDVEVREERIEPPWEPWEPREGSLKGGRRWLLTIPAGKTVKAKAEYVVRIPSKMELVGGNRRER